MELKFYTIMKYAIYGIVNPIDKQVVYVGQTKDLNLEHYLNSKYWKLNEVKRGERNWNKLFHFLDELPVRAEIKLLAEADNTKPFQNPNGLELVYIKKYRQINPNLLNETDGGIGGYTIKYKTDDEKKKVGSKISNKLKGRKKPEGFAERLSLSRKSGNNPMAKRLNIGIYKNNTLIKILHYGCDVNTYLGNKWFWSNKSRLVQNGFAAHYKDYVVKLVNE